MKKDSPQEMTVTEIISEEILISRMLRPKKIRGRNELMQPGVHSERLKSDNPREIIFARLWDEENERIKGTNGGCGLLEILLSNSPTFDEIEPVSERDAVVAATVIQYLGSNNGRSFLEEAQHRIKLYERLRSLRMFRLGQLKVKAAVFIPRYLSQCFRNRNQLTR